MLRRAFLKRMAFAALATWFLDLPLPAEPGRLRPAARTEADALSRLGVLFPGSGMGFRRAVIEHARRLA